jgi:hypothetical protein
LTWYHYGASFPAWRRGSPTTTSRRSRRSSSRLTPCVSHGRPSRTPRRSGSRWRR